MSAAALVTDLMFGTKIASTARSLEISLTMVRNLDGLKNALTDGVGLVIVDMNVDGVDPVEAILCCKQAESPPFVIAYLSHIQAELNEAAQQAKADLVLPRSHFSAELPNLLQQYSPTT